MKKALLLFLLASGLANAQSLQLQGGTGVPGSGYTNTIRNGAGAPAFLIGNNGDFYIDTTAHVLYGPKAAGVWPSSGIPFGGGSGSPVWGAITGLLVNQPDLQSALDALSSALAGKPPLAPNAYYASEQTGADVCVQIQAAIDAATTAGGGNVYADFPQAIYTCAAGYTVKPGVWLHLGHFKLVVGAPIVVNEAHMSGMGGNSNANYSSWISAANGLNSTVVQLTGVESSFWQYGGVSDLRIDGNGSNQTAGNCMDVSQMADTAYIRNIVFLNCWGSGLTFTGVGSGATGATDISVFNSGVGTPSAPIYMNGAISSYTFLRMHVGGNIGPGFACKAGSGGLRINLQQYQIETLGVTGAASPAILIDNTTSICGITANNFSVSAAATASNDFIQSINGSSTTVPDIQLSNVALSTSYYSNWFDDAVHGLTIPLSNVTTTGRIPYWSTTSTTRVISGGTAYTPGVLTLVNGANQNVKTSLRTSGSGNGYSATYVRFAGPTGAFSIGGLTCNLSTGVGGFDGSHLILENTTAQVMTIDNLDAGSTAANQILTKFGRNVDIAPGGTVELFYNTANTQWDLTGMSTPNYLNAITGLAGSDTLLVSGASLGSTAGIATCTDSNGGITIAGCGGSVATTPFSGITSGTNTSAAMLVGSGASLAVTGSGTIAATSMPASGVTTGTVAAAVTVGSGGSIAVSGTGTVQATNDPGITGYCNGTVGTGNGTVYYLWPFANPTSAGNPCTATSGTEIPMANACTFKNLYVTSGTAGAVAGSGVITLFTGGNARAITCTLGTGLPCNDTTHTFSVAAGATYSLRVKTGQATDTTANVRAAIQCQ